MVVGPLKQKELWPSWREMGKLWLLVSSASSPPMMWPLLSLSFQLEASTCTGPFPVLSLLCEWGHGPMMLLTFDLLIFLSALNLLSVSFPTAALCHLAGLKQANKQTKYTTTTTATTTTTTKTANENPSLQRTRELSLLNLTYHWNSSPWKFWWMTHQPLVTYSRLGGHWDSLLLCCLIWASASGSC